MPPNARDSDSISQEAEHADITHVTAVTNGASNSDNNVQNNNLVHTQNGDGLPQASSTTRTEETNNNISTNGYNNVQSNLMNGAEASTRVEDANTTIYIIPGCDTSLNQLSSTIRDHQPELNGNGVSMQPHLFLLPSAPHPSSLTHPHLAHHTQQYPSYNQSAPPDYYTTSNNPVTNGVNQPRIYTVAPAPYGDPPPEYDSWSHDPSNTRNASSEGVNLSSANQPRYQQYHFSHPFQPISYSEECRDHTISGRPISATSTSTLCCTNDASRPERLGNLNPALGFQGRERDGCTICSIRNNPQQRQRGHLNNEQVFNISGNTRCGPTCHYQFPIQTDLSHSGATNADGEEGDEEEYDRMTNTPSLPEYLTVKRWIMVVLLILLLTTFSLLLGVSMQHYQLLKKFVSLNKSISDRGDNKLFRYHPKFGGKINHIFSVPARTSTTPMFPNGQESENDNSVSKTDYNEKRKRDIPKYISNIKSCNNAIDLPTRENLNFILSKLPSTDTSNSKLVDALCSHKFDLELLELKSETGRNNYTLHGSQKDGMILEAVCFELQPIIQSNTQIVLNVEKLLQDLKSQDCISIDKDIETSLFQHGSGLYSIDCPNHLNNSKASAQKNKMLKRQNIFPRLLLLVAKCASTEHVANDVTTTPVYKNNESSSSKYLPRK